MATMGDRRARDRSVGALIGLVAATLTITGALTAQAQSPKPMPPVANDCFAIGSVQGDGYLRTDGDTYAADATAARAERFWLKPTALSNRFLIQGSDGRLLTAAGHGVSAQSIPGRDAEWTVFASPTEPGVISHAHEFLTTTRGNGMRLASRHADDWRLTPSAGCSPYPEAGPGATGRPFTGTNPDGTVSGFIDAHLHITANLRAGGRVIHGEPFDRFGITEALGHDADDHGADGSVDVTGNLLRDGIPFGTHDTHGWPTFAGWPVNDTNTHQQIYYGWLAARLDVRPAPGRRPERSRTSRSAGSSRCARTPAARPRRSASRSTSCATSRTTSTRRAAAAVAAGCGSLRARARRAG